MRLLLGLVLLTLSLSACKGSLPPKPDLDICRVLVSQPSPEPSGLPTAPFFGGCKCAKGDGELYDLTPDQCKAHLAFDPDQLHALFNYIIEVERIATKHCRGAKNGIGALETVRDFDARQAVLMGR